MGHDPREPSLAEISRLLAESLDLPVVTRRIAETVRELFHVHTAVLVTVDAGGGIIGIGGAGPLPPLLFRLRRRSTLASRPISDGVPYRTEDILNDSRVTPRPADREAIAQSGHRAVMTVPLLSRGRVIGALSVGDQVGRVYDDEEVRLAEAFAAQAAIALENARLYNEAQTLLTVGPVVAGVSDVAEALRLVCRELSRLTGASTVSAHLASAAGRGLVPTAGYRVPKDVLGAIQGAGMPLSTEGFPQAGLAIRNVRLFQEAEIRRRMAEEAKERYRLLFERNLAGVLRTASDGRMARMQRRVRPDRRVRDAGRGSRPEHSRVLGRSRGAPGPARASGPRPAADERDRRAPARRRQSLLAAHQPHDDPGDEATIEGIGLDITDHQRAEQAERDVQALRSITRLANAAAHEINNPLAIIFGNLDMMKPRVAGDAVLADRVERALTAAQRIVESVAAMRQITRLETAAAQPDLPERLDLKRSRGS